MANYCDYKGILKGPKNACYHRRSGPKPNRDQF